jgi:hypothetical protein
MMCNTWRVKCSDGKFLYATVEGWPSEGRALLEADDPIWSRRDVEYMPERCHVIDPQVTHCRPRARCEYTGRPLPYVFWLESD